MFKVDLVISSNTDEIIWLDYCNESSHFLQVPLSNCSSGFIETQINTK